MEDRNLAIDALREISANYLYRDILELENLKRTDVILKLLKALALQMGSEVSLINELATLTGVTIHLSLISKFYTFSPARFQLKSTQRNRQKI